MIKIPGLTPDQVVKIVQKVASNHGGKAFGCYASEDIEQEVWVITLNAIDDFTFAKSKTKDVGTALEHWLNVVVSRRLHNFYRDKFLVPQKALKADRSTGEKQKRVNLMHPLDVQGVTEDVHFFLEDIAADTELWERVVIQLSDELYDILDSIMSGEITNCYYKSKLLVAIKEILNSIRDDQDD